MWCPPTPPQQDSDVYIDQTINFLYDAKVMPESQLPPVYIKKDLKRSRQDCGSSDSRRPLKMARKDDTICTPRSLFERPTPALMKMRRDLKMQKYRNMVRPQSSVHGVKLPMTKPLIESPPWHAWTINEDMAILKVLQAIQGLPLGLTILTPGHTPNWDLVADYVNTVSMAYRSPKQCRQRYDNVIHLREEGKQTFDSSARKKKTKGSTPIKLPAQTKSSRPFRTSELHAQDNNTTYYQILTQREDCFLMFASKRNPPIKPVLNNPLLKNPKHSAVLAECGIDLDHPTVPADVSLRRNERIIREKKNTIAEQQRSQQLKGQMCSQVPTTVAQIITPATTIQTVSSPISQSQVISQANTTVTSATATIITTPNTQLGQLRTQQRLIGTPIQTQSVVSVSGLSPAQLQAATQRLIVSGTPGQAKAVVSGTATIAGKPISPAQFQMIRQASLKQHQQLRLQAGALTAQGLKTTTVTIAGQTAVQVQFTQAQARTGQQFVKQGTVTVGKRPVSEVDISQIFKRQQQKVLVSGSGPQQATTIQSLSPQVFAQAIQQAGSSGTQVATLVKSVSNSGVTQTVTIPVSGVTIGGTPVKATLASGLKSNNSPMRQVQVQQQLVIQKKFVNPKTSNISQVTGKGGVATQLIVGSKPISTALTMQQFQQVIRTPLGVQQGPVVLAKAPSRVIPVNASQGTKQTIQVVAASQGLAAAIRPQSSSTLAGALAGIKVQGNVTSQAQQVILSQVSAALQNQVRQNSPVRIQTSSGTPLVAVSVQSSNLQSNTSPLTTNTDKVEQVSRFVKK